MAVATACTTEGNKVAAGIDYRDVHFPIELLGHCHDSVDGCLRAFE